MKLRRKRSDDHDEIVRQLTGRFVVMQVDQNRTIVMHAGRPVDIPPGCRFETIPPAPPPRRKIPAAYDKQ